jgi:hypothetical protein
MKKKRYLDFLFAYLLTFQGATISMRPMLGDRCMRAAGACAMFFITTQLLGMG